MLYEIVYRNTDKESPTQWARLMRSFKNEDMAKKHAEEETREGIMQGWRVEKIIKI